MDTNEIPRCRSPEILWDPPDLEAILEPDKNGNNIWGLKTVWCYQEPGLHSQSDNNSTIQEDVNDNDSIFLDSTFADFHELCPIDELSESCDTDSECISIQNFPTPAFKRVRQEPILSPGEQLLANRLRTKYGYGADGCYSSEDEEDVDPIFTAIIKCREVYNALDPNRPPKLVVPKVINWPSAEEKERMKAYAKHFDVRVDADGGIFTSDDDSVFEMRINEIKTPKVKVQRIKKTRKKDNKKYRLFRAIQGIFVKKFSQVSKRHADDRHLIYSEINIHDLIPIDDFSVSRCIELVDCIFSAVEERPGIVFFCAEFCKYQYDLLSYSNRRYFISAIMRCIKVNISGDQVDSEEEKKIKFLYVTLLGHLYNFGICPPKVIRYYVIKFFQTNNFEMNRLAYFDSDYTIYVTRLISLIIYKWTSINNNTDNCQHTFPSSLGQLKKWMLHLKRADKTPPHVKADLSIFFSNFSSKGKLLINCYSRNCNCEVQEELDDLVLITKNSFGRKLFCCREILALYSYTFYQFFYRRYVPGKKEIYLDVEFCAMREILRILYHCDRKFTSLHFREYDEGILLLMARAALQLDLPIIYRLCEEQLFQHFSLPLALRTLNLGLGGITRRCLPFLDPSDLHELLKFIIYGQRINMGVQTTDAVELDTLLSTLGFIRFHKLSRRRAIRRDPQAELIFPLDFTTPWVLSDVVIETVGSGGRFLFANRTILSTFSPFFKNYPYLKARKWRGHWRVETNEKYPTVRAALRVIHHVKQKFIPQRLPTLLPTMLVRLYRCAKSLNFPLILQMCDEQLSIASHAYLLSVLKLMGTKLQPDSRQECRILVKKVLQLAD